VPFELLQSPIEKAKNVLEDEIFFKLKKKIDAFSSKYVTLFYFPRTFLYNSKVNNTLNKIEFAGFLAKELSLAECFIKNDWDRDEKSIIGFHCARAVYISKVEFDDNGGPTVFLNKSYERLFYEKACVLSSMDFFADSLASRTRYIALVNKTFIFSYNAIYNSYPDGVYSPKTQWNISPAIISTLAKNLDFDDIYRRYINKYWGDNYLDFIKKLRLSFLQSVSYQLKEGSLSLKGATLAQGMTEKDRQVSWHFLGLARPRLVKWKFWVGDLFATSKKYSAFSFDIFYIINQTDGHVLLYVPGNSSPIHEFSNITALHLWFANQTRNITKRDVLLTHFLMGDWESITAFFKTFHAEGVREILYAMAQTNLNLGAINNYFVLSDPIYSLETLFVELTEKMMKKCKDDISYMITSNRDKTKELAVHWVQTISLFILPLTIICPQCIILDVLFLTETAIKIGIGVDDLMFQKAIAGERLYFGVLNSLPLVPRVIGVSVSSSNALSNILKQDRYTALIGLKAKLKNKKTKTQKLLI
jgi:hypothetical protein